MVDLAEIAPAAQTRLYSLQQAIPVKGHAQIEEWRERAANYPNRLTHAMLEENLAFGGFWYGAEMFAARDDQLQLYDIFIDTAQQLLGALHGLNRLYLPTPDHLKWMDEMIGEMSIKPDNLSARLKRVFHVEPVVGVADLRELIVETLVLVEEHTADFDLTPYRPSAQDSRGRWDQPPRRLD